LGDSDDELERCISVLRFWFTKDLKFIKGRLCEPYNSTLGEFFRCHWDVERPSPASEGDGSKPILVSFLTEQTSHHPPISAFYIECKEKGLSAKGYDQVRLATISRKIDVTQAPNVLIDQCQIYGNVYQGLPWKPQSGYFHQSSQQG